MMETVFVTGGGSQLGQHVLRRLMSRMRIIAMVHRRKIDLPGAEMELLHGGLEETIRNPIALKRAQVILHMAAVTHSDNPAEYFRVNAELTRRNGLIERRYQAIESMVVSVGNPGMSIVFSPPNILRSARRPRIGGVAGSS